MTNSNGKLLCSHLMPTEYADYVTFVFGFVHVWCCHKFVCLCDGKEGDSDGKEGRVMGRRGQ